MNTAREARQMLRSHRYGALSTLSKKFDGYPFGSITPYLVDHNGGLIILISTLAEHTKNILNNPRVSLITHNQNAPHIQTQGRVTVLGDAQLIADREQTGARYLRYFPEAEGYFGMHDFSFYRIMPIAIRYIGGFGKIHWADLADYSPQEFEAYAQHETQILATLNTRQKNTLKEILKQQFGVSEPEALVIGLDCDGLDLRSGEQVWRLDFANELSDPGQALQALKQFTRTQNIEG
jgi:putative heme iron utilization protein